MTGKKKRGPSLERMLSEAEDMLEKATENGGWKEEAEPAQHAKTNQAQRAPKTNQAQRAPKTNQGPTNF